jgi:predicted transcriptional regulator
MTDHERAAVNEGLEQARRGAFVFDEQMRDLWRRLDVA